MLHTYATRFITVAFPEKFLDLNIPGEEKKRPTKPTQAGEEKKKDR
jgi:hypothetical protein